MKREHYAHVSERFNLAQYADWNGPDFWDSILERFGAHDFDWLGDRECWRICARYAGMNIFTNIPTEELAREILEYMKTTEILFV